MFFNRERIKYFDLIIAAILAFIGIELVMNYKAVILIVGKGIKILTPFIIALIIAYILNPFVNLLENRLKLKRGISILITYSIITGLIYLFLIVVFPKMFSSIMDIVNNIPYFTQSIYKWINTHDIFNFMNSGDFIKNNAVGLIQKFGTLTSDSLNIILNKTLLFTGSLINVVFGFLVSIYILFDKEKIQKITKDTMDIILKERTSNKIIKLVKNIDDMVKLYIGTKAIDSLIIGIVCLIGLVIIKSPYALLISIIVCVTNMLPYFGPVVGMVPAFVINLFYDPKKAFAVLIFLILLQQFDAWILEPKLVGIRVGISPLLVILAITIGGSLFGVWGMLLASPIMAVIKIYVEKWFEINSHKLNRVKKCSDE